MEASNQVLEATVEDGTAAVKQLMVGAKILRAKKTFLTALDTFRGKLRRGPPYDRFLLRDTHEERERIKREVLEEEEEEERVLDVRRFEGNETTVPDIPFLLVGASQTRGNNGATPAGSK